MMYFRIADVSDSHQGLKAVGFICDDDGAIIGLLHSTDRTSVGNVFLENLL